MSHGQTPYTRDYTAYFIGLYKMLPGFMEGVLTMAHMVISCRPVFILYIHLEPFGVAAPWRLMGLTNYL